MKVPVSRLKIFYLKSGHSTCMKKLARQNGHHLLLTYTDTVPITIKSCTNSKCQLKCALESSTGSLLTSNNLLG